MRPAPHDGQGLMRTIMAGGCAWALLAAGPAVAQPAEAGAPLDRMFQELDADGDDAISLEERRAGRERQFDQLDQDGDGFIVEADLPERSAGPRRGRGRGFARMDGDGDGAVSRAEFVDAEPAMFTRLDADGDGRLTRDEAAAARGWRDRLGAARAGSAQEP